MSRYNRFPPSKSFSRSSRRDRSGSPPGDRFHPYDRHAPDGIYDDEIITPGARKAQPAFFRRNDASGFISPAHTNQQGNAVMARVCEMGLTGTLTEEVKAECTKKLTKLAETQVEGNPFGAWVVAHVAQRATKEQTEKAIDDRLAMFRQEVKQENAVETTSLMDKFLGSEKFGDAVVDAFDRKICASIGKATRMVVEENVDTYHKKNVAPFMKEYTKTTAQINEKHDDLAQISAVLAQKVGRLEALVAGGAGAVPPPSAPSHPTILPTPGAIKAAKAHGFTEAEGYLFMDATGTKVIPVKEQKKRADDINAGNFP